MARIGRVTNGYSNYLALLAIDAKHAAAYKGPNDHDAEGSAVDDFERANAQIERGRSTFVVGNGKGILAEIGGCGSSEVHRFGDAIVMVEHYTGDDDADAEAALDRTIAMHPTTNAKLLGPLEVPSGVLALLSLIEEGVKVDLAATKKTGVAKLRGGCAIAVKPGRYQLWRESFEVEGPWGSIASRLRIVPSGTKVTKGAPIVELAAPPAPRTATDGVRRLVDPAQKWAAIASLAVAGDGRTFAGECGGFGCAAWAADGALLWQRAIAKNKAGRRYEAELGVQLVGADLLAFPRYGTAICVLDPATGKQRRAVKVPKARSFLVAGDRLILRTETETTVLSWPAAKPIAKLEEYVNGSDIAANASWLVMDGYQLQIYDAKLQHAHTIEPELDASAIVFAGARLATGDGKARVRFYDPKTAKLLATIDAAKERVRKPSINALAASATHLAAARDDGTVALIDLAAGKVVKLYEKHHVEIPDTGATQLNAVAFSADGATLWVSAGAKGAPIGLTAYTIAASPGSPKRRS